MARTKTPTKRVYELIERKSSGAYIHTKYRLNIRPQDTDDLAEIKETFIRDFAKCTLIGRDFGESEVGLKHASSRLEPLVTVLIETERGPDYTGHPVTKHYIIQIDELKEGQLIVRLPYIIRSRA